MLDFSRLNAIQCVDDSSKSNTIRVYYQNEDLTIRESCYDDQRKWFTTGDIVTDKAKKRSPIAATGWNDGTELHFRVYYIDTSNQIGERVGKSQGGGKTEWKDGGDLKSANLATVSQLAVARPGQDRSNLRVYYQDQTNNVREITYFERRGNWSVSPQMFPTARAGTSISAVSAKPPGDVRLYFQGDNNKLREWFMNGRNNGNQNPWSSGAIGDFTLDAGAPINAICWYDDMTDPKNPQNLNINVFTIADKPSEAAQLSYSSDQGWDSSPSFVANIYRTSTESSAIGTCQVTGNKKGAIHVFYQPESQVIDLKPVAISAGSAGAAEVQAVVLPKGIPTVR